MLQLKISYFAMDGNLNQQLMKNKLLIHLIKICNELVLQMMIDLDYTIMSMLNHKYRTEHQFKFRNSVN